MSEKSQGSVCDASALGARWHWQRGPGLFEPRRPCGPKAVSLGWRTWCLTPISTTSSATIFGAAPEIVRLRMVGVPRTIIAAVAATWPDAGFHQRLVGLTIDRWWKHPLNPLPMVKWQHRRFEH